MAVKKEKVTKDKVIQGKILFELGFQDNELELLSDDLLYDKVNLLHEAVTTYINSYLKDNSIKSLETEIMLFQETGTDKNTISSVKSFNKFTKE